MLCLNKEGLKIFLKKTSVFASFEINILNEHAVSLWQWYKIPGLVHYEEVTSRPSTHLHFL